MFFKRKTNKEAAPMNREYDPRRDREILIDIERKQNELMATDTEVLTAVQTLKTDLTTKLEAITAELTRLQGELPNPEVLDQALTAVTELDSTVNAFTVPTA